MRRPIRLLAALAAAATLGGCVTATPFREAGRPTFAGQVVVVTGASSGFGRGIAQAFGARGAAVVLAARRADLLEQVATVIGASGGRALVVPTDVGDPAAVERLSEAAVQAFGRVDVWVDDAGTAVFGRFDQASAADHARVIDVNLKGVIYGSHAALTLFKRQGAGVLINMGSTESYAHLPYHASYVASKAAILALDNALDEELRLQHATGVHVVTIEPWATDTPFWNNAANVTGHRGRMVLLDDPEPVVQAVLWAARHPGRQEIAVGWKAKGAIAGARLTPRLTERIGGAVLQGALLRGAPAPPDPHGLYAPDPSRAPEHTDVEGGVRARMKAVDAARGAAPPPAGPL